MKPNNQLKTWLSQAEAFLSPASDRNKGCEGVISCKAIHHQAKIKNLKIQPEGTCKYPVLFWHFDWWPPLLISASCLRRFPKNSLAPTSLLPHHHLPLWGRQGLANFSLTSPFHCVTTHDHVTIHLWQGHLHWPFAEGSIFAQCSSTVPSIRRHRKKREGEVRSSAGKNTKPHIQLVEEAGSPQTPPSRDLQLRPFAKNFSSLQLRAKKKKKKTTQNKPIKNGQRIWTVF